MLRKRYYKLDFIVVLVIGRQLISSLLTKNVYIVVEVGWEALTNLSGGEGVFKVILYVVLNACDLGIYFVKVSRKELVALALYSSVEGNSRD